MKRRNPIFKVIASSLSLVLFTTNVLLAHAPESNLWAQRRGDKTPMVLASLPAAPALTLPALARSLTSISSQIRKEIPSGLESHYAPIILSLPASYGTVRKISAPLHQKNPRTVIHIQDVHLNPEAQENIEKAIQELINRKQVGFVALEGAFGPMNFSAFRKFPYPDSTLAVANFLFREKKISGAVRTAFISQEPIPAFIGVDDSAHYRANVDAYKRSVSFKEARKSELTILASQLNQDKTKTFNKELAAFDAHVQDYREGKSSWGDHVRLLAAHSTAPSRNIDLFLEALNLESSLNFTKVESERKQLLAKLVSRLTQEQTADLVNHSVAYRLGTIGHSGFYQYLKTLCGKNRIDLSHYKSMDGYIRYVLLSDSVNIEGTLLEAAAMEKSIYGRLAKTEGERALIQTSRQLFLTGRLLNFSLSMAEWKEYAGLKPSRVQNMGDLSAFEAFYVEAQKRDSAMTENVIRAMDQSNASVVVLVTGGFHAEGIAEAMKAKGIATIAYVPRITKIEDESGSRYLSVFSQEKTPLDKLFAGEKLFVSPPVMVDPAPALVLDVEHALLVHPQATLAQLADYVPAGATAEVDRKAGTAKVTTGVIEQSVVIGGDRQIVRATARRRAGSVDVRLIALLAVPVLMIAGAIAAAAVGVSLAVIGFSAGGILILGGISVVGYQIYKARPVNSGMRRPLEIIGGISAAVGLALILTAAMLKPVAAPVIAPINAPVPPAPIVQKEAPQPVDAPVKPTVVAPEKKTGQPATAKGLSVVRNDQGVWLNVKGQLWSGAPGVAYQPTPDGENINQYERSRLAYLYKALLPPENKWTEDDKEKYPELWKLVQKNEGAKPQDHARLIAESGFKFIRTYNLTETTEEDLKQVSRIFQWMHEKYGVMFTAGMHDPREIEVRRAGPILRNNPGLLLYDGWNEIDARSGTNEQTIERIDSVAGALKAVDPDHPITIVVTQTVNAKLARAIKASKNIDVVGVTIYNRDGKGSAEYVKGLQDYFDPKAVIVSEFGVRSDKSSPEERAGLVKGFQEAMTMTEKGKAAPAPVHTHFYWSKEKWKGDDQHWELVDGQNRPTPALTAMAEVNKRWVPGPKASDVSGGPAKKDGDPEPKDQIDPKAPEYLEISLTAPYSGVDYLGKYSKVTKNQSDAIVKHKYLRVTVRPDNYKDLTGFHVDLKGAAELAVFSLYVKKIDGKWSLYDQAGDLLKNSKAAIEENEKEGHISVTIPYSEINEKTITALHVQTGKQQSGVSLNSKNVPAAIKVEAFTPTPQKKKTGSNRPGHVDIRLLAVLSGMGLLMGGAVWALSAGVSHAVILTVTLGIFVAAALAALLASRRKPAGENKKETAVIQKLALEIQKEFKPEASGADAIAVNDVIRNIELRQGAPSFDLAHAIRPQGQSAKIEKTFAIGLALAVKIRLGVMFQSLTTALATAFATNENILTIVHVNDEADLGKVREALAAAKEHNAGNNKSVAVVGVVVTQDAVETLDQAVLDEIIRLNSGVSATVARERDLPRDGDQIAYATLFTELASLFGKQNDTRAQTLFTELTQDNVKDKKIVVIGASKTAYSASESLMRIMISLVPVEGGLLMLNIQTVLLAAKMA